MKQTWFLTELIYHNTNADNSQANGHLFDKQMRLFKASNVREAYQQSLVLATKELDARNKDYQSNWEFVAIGILQTVEHPEHSIDRIELHYTLDTDTDADLHLVSLRLRQNVLLHQIALTA